jgi:hypothetical protein
MGTEVAIVNDDSNHYEYSNDSEDPLGIITLAESL